MVPVVVLLCDLWGRTDHQNTALQRSCATAWGQRLRGEWERDSEVHCQAMSKLVPQLKEEFLNKKQLCSSTYCVHMSLDPLGQHSPCALAWLPVSLLGNVDQNQLSMFSHCNKLIISVAAFILSCLFTYQEVKNLSNEIQGFPKKVFSPILLLYNLEIKMRLDHIIRTTCCRFKCS